MSKSNLSSTSLTKLSLAQKVKKKQRKTMLIKEREKIRNDLLKELDLIENSISSPDLKILLDSLKVGFDRSKTEETISHDQKVKNPQLFKTNEEKNITKENKFYQKDLDEPNYPICISKPEEKNIPTTEATKVLDENENISEASSEKFIYNKVNLEDEEINGVPNEPKDSINEEKDDLSDYFEKFKLTNIRYSKAKRKGEENNYYARYKKNGDDSNDYTSYKSFFDSDFHQNNYSTINEQDDLSEYFENVKILIPRSSPQKERNLENEDAKICENVPFEESNDPKIVNAEEKDDLSQYFGNILLQDRRSVSSKVKNLKSEDYSNFENDLPKDNDEQTDWIIEEREDLSIYFQNASISSHKEIKENHENIKIEENVKNEKLFDNEHKDPIIEEKDDLSLYFENINNSFSQEIVENVEDIDNEDVIINNETLLDQKQIESKRDDLCLYFATYGLPLFKKKENNPENEEKIDHEILASQKAETETKNKDFNESNQHMRMLTARSFIENEDKYEIDNNIIPKKIIDQILEKSENSNKDEKKGLFENTRTLMITNSKILNYKKR